MFGGVFAEFPAKLSRNKDRPQLAFHGNAGSSFFDRIGGDVWDFTDADPRGADGFHQALVGLFLDEQGRHAGSVANGLGIGTAVADDGDVLKAEQRGSAVFRIVHLFLDISHL